MQQLGSIQFGLALLLCFCGTFAYGQAEDMVLVEGGDYMPFIKGQTDQVHVSPFWMDVKAVTNADYLKFTLANPQWSKNQAKRIFADENYLSHWAADNTFQNHEKAPVVNVSWFAAQAYCEWAGKRLPKLHEWEFAAKSLPVEHTSYNSTQQIIADWYANRMQNPFEAGSVYQNIYGIWDMHGLIWEWVYDFNSITMNDDGRNQEQIAEGLFCGSASLNANDAADYASFVRFAFRTSLKGNYSLRKLGFRCAKNQD